MILGTHTPNQGRHIINAKIGQVYSVTDGQYAGWEAANPLLRRRQYAPVTINNGTTDATAAITATIAAAIAGGGGTVFFPPGTYAVNSGSAASQFLTSGAEYLNFVGLHARIEIQDGCAATRIFVAQGAQHLKFFGLELVETRSSIKASALCYENSSWIDFEECVFRDFKVYGIAGTELTGVTSVRATTISYDGTTDRILDSANGLGAFVVGQTITCTGSIWNDGLKTITAVDPSGGWLEVAEELTTEGAGATRVYALSQTLAFIGDIVTDETSAALDMFRADDTITFSGSTSNNITTRINEVSDDGLWIQCDDTFTTEAAGATVTITRVGRSTVRLIDAEPCDHISIRNCSFRGIGTAGITHFPKALSSHFLADGNHFYNCGFVDGVTSGVAGKLGQNTIDAIITNNLVEHCNFGFAIGNWESSIYSGNIFVNVARGAIAITGSQHVLIAQSSLASLDVSGNTCIIGKDFSPDADGNPVYSDDLYAPPSSQCTAFQYNGLVATNGPANIHHNTVVGFPHDLMLKATQNYPHISYSSNKIVNCGATIAEPRFINTAKWGTGVSLLTEVKNTDGVLSTSGWRVGMVVQGPGIPDGTTVADLDPFLKTLNISSVTTTASDGGTGAAAGTFYSGAPEGFVFAHNEYVADTDSATVIRIRSRRAKVHHNQITRYGAYALQVGGTQSDTYQNYFTEINGLCTYDGSGVLLTGIDDRGPIRLLTDFAGPLTGTPLCHHNYLDMGRLSGTRSDGLPRYMRWLVMTGDVASAQVFNNSCSNPAVGTLYPSLVATPINAVIAQAGQNRVDYGSSAPTSGNRRVGDIRFNNAPTAQKGIAFWYCVVSNSIGGVWQAVGYGSGTNAQEAALALTSNDTGFTWRNTDTSLNKRWTGSAFLTV